MRSLFRTALVGAALVVAVPALGQQITSGTVTGITKDEQGLVLPGANVELRNEDTGESRQTVSNTAGVFNFPGTSAGRYSMKVSLQGFRTSERSGIQLRTGEIYDAGSVVMVVGQFTEVTTVSADLAFVQTASAERTSVLEAAQLDSLIVRGRDPMSLLNLLPGVTPVVGVSALGGQIGPVTPSIGGQLGIAAGLALDGQAASDGDTGRMGTSAAIPALQLSNRAARTRPGTSLPAVHARSLQLASRPAQRHAVLDRGLGALLGIRSSGKSIFRAMIPTASACCSGARTARHASCSPSTTSSATGRRSNAWSSSSIASVTSARMRRRKCGAAPRRHRCTRLHTCWAPCNSELSTKNSSMQGA